MKNFTHNIDLEGYTNFSTATCTNKGGTIIYTKSTFDVTERLDLNITICMSRSGSKLKIKVVKMLFVAPSTDIQMTIFYPMIIFWTIWNRV